MWLRYLSILTRKIARNVTAHSTGMLCQHMAWTSYRRKPTVLPAMIGASQQLGTTAAVCNGSSMMLAHLRIHPHSLH